MKEAYSWLGLFLVEAYNISKYHDIIVNTAMAVGKKFNFLTSHNIIISIYDSHDIIMIIKISPTQNEHLLA